MLGVAVSNILRGRRLSGGAGATYPGDIGMHVIKCLWCYEKFHKGEEPADPLQRGRWLGEIYS